MYRNNLFSIGLFSLIGFIFIFSSATHAGAASPYDQCYQTAMNGETGNFAERAARTACRKKFPDTESKGAALPIAAIKKLKIDAGFGWGIFNGSIFNGNPDYRITQLTVSMTPIHDHHMEMTSMASHETKEYSIDLNLTPLSKSALSLAIDTDDVHVHDFEWKILRALGHKTK